MKKDIYSDDNLSVYNSDGDFITCLNYILVKKQNLSEDDIELLKLTHIIRALIFKAMKLTDNASELKRQASIFESLEFLQQELWKFEKNKNHHCWFEVPKCTCPILDNLDRIGFEDCVINDSCPIHGIAHD